MFCWLPDVALAFVIAACAGALGRLAMRTAANRLGVPHGRMLGRFAAVLIWGVGIVAALSRVAVPVSVTLPILIAVLVVVGGGVLAVLVGPGSFREIHCQRNALAPVRASPRTS